MKVNLDLIIFTGFEFRDGYQLLVHLISNWIVVIGLLNWNQVMEKHKGQDTQSCLTSNFEESPVNQNWCHLIDKPTNLLPIFFVESELSKLLKWKFKIFRKSFF